MHDTDVPCAVVAAGCLNNYIMFANADTGSSSGSVLDEVEVEVAAAAATTTLMEKDASTTNKQHKKKAVNNRLGIAMLVLDVT
eukprot:7964063-Ditylum_brightwellii.AAC.1